MKIKRIFAALLSGLLLLIEISGTSTTSVQAAVTWPSGPNPKKLSCDSAIVMEVSTGLILYKKNIHKKHYPASITKIMTAMLALENSSLSETVKFSSDAVYGIEAGSSTIYSEVDERMSMEQCLYAIMLESANEVCLAIGEHVAGSSEKFVDMMNERVAELGLKNTHFNNPNGLPDTKHYTSAYDMSVIARQAIQNSTFRKICGTKRYTCAKTNKHKTTRLWLNHHSMLSGANYPQYIYKYCTGGKTGYTQAAGSTLVTYAEKDGMQLVCVIMKSGSPKRGEPNEYTDTTTLLNFGFEKYKKYNIADAKIDVNSNLFNNYGSFFNAEESPVHLASESSVILPKNAKLSNAKQKITYNKTTIKDGINTIGKVTYTYGGKVVGSTDIIYEKKERTYLDSASRQIVTDEIQGIEDDSKKAAKKRKRFVKIKSILGNVGNTIADLVSKLIDTVQEHLEIVLIILAAVLVLSGIIVLVKTISRRRKNRLHIGSGGYRSRRGRRKHAHTQRRNRRRSYSSSRKSHKRRNHSRHYQNKQLSGIVKKRKPTNYKKRRKNTRESFGKNFFDF